MIIDQLVSYFRGIYNYIIFYVLVIEFILYFLKNVIVLYYLFILGYIIYSYFNICSTYIRVYHD